jgi:hypothetical protein
VTTTTPGIELRPGGQRGWPPAAAGRSGKVACVVYPRGSPAGRARVPAPGRRVRITEPIEDSTARLAARTTGCRPGPAPGRGRLPAHQLLVRAAGLGPGRRRAAGRLQVKGTGHEVACQLDVDFPRHAARRPAAQHHRQRPGHRLEVGNQPTDPGTRPPHHDDVLILARTGHVSGWSSSAARPCGSLAVGCGRPGGLFRMRCLPRTP